jgi:hypothetical protein
MIAVSDFIFFCNRTLDGMESAAGKLDESRLNIRPDLPGANTVFQLVTHSTAACEYWVSHIVCGRVTARDRDAEFQASGTAADLRAAILGLRSLLEELRPALETVSELGNEPQTQTPLGQPWTVGAALIHAYEELAQHLGHIEITADIVAAP